MLIVNISSPKILRNFTNKQNFVKNCENIDFLDEILIIGEKVFKTPEIQRHTRLLVDVEKRFKITLLSLF